MVESEARLAAPRRSHLSDEDFLKWLHVVGGTPPELLAKPEVLKLFLPALKADLHVVESYRWVASVALLPRHLSHVTQVFLQLQPAGAPTPVLPSHVFRWDGGRSS